MRPNSLPCKIGGSYAWQVCQTDYRRKSVLGRDGLTCTRIKVKACMLEGGNLGPDAWTKPVLKALDEATAVDDEAEPEAEDDDEPNVATKMWRGWRLSYRSIEPENAPAPQFLASLVAI